MQDAVNVTRASELLASSQTECYRHRNLQFTGGFFFPRSRAA